jgi:3'(2'), 5'-bisphosphate nucleotidase
MQGDFKDSELESVLEIAREAAQLIREVYVTPFSVELKGPNDPVTRADREGNELICRRLEERFPGAAILAEESVPENPEDIAKLLGNERVFFVDPLDGTREFADKIPEFAVMIGLAVRGRPVLGVVVMPEQGDALCGKLGEQTIAFRESANGERTALRVSDVVDPTAAKMMVSRSHRPKLIDPLAAHLGITQQGQSIARGDGRCRGLRSCGQRSEALGHVCSGSDPGSCRRTFYGSRWTTDRLHDSRHCDSEWACRDELGAF